jgi:hypothetical protein
MKPLVTLAVIMAMTLVLAISLAMAQQQPPAQGQQQPVQAQRPPAPPAAPGTVTFNTVITKLKNKQQVFCNTVSDPDTAAARKACEGQDYIWIEMQHSTLTWREAQNLIEAVASAGCIPFVRVPSANVGDIQKGTDAGALGIIVPWSRPCRSPECGPVFQVPGRQSRIPECQAVGPSQLRPEPCCLHLGPGLPH